MTNCLKCNRPLRAIGRQRKNGRDFQSGANLNNDWAQRQYHKKCWKEEQEFLWLKMLHKDRELEKVKKENRVMKDVITNTDYKNKEEIKKIIAEDPFIVTFK